LTHLQTRILAKFSLITLQCPPACKYSRTAERIFSEFHTVKFVNTRRSFLIQTTPGPSRV
jgi:hypothetical protein